MEHTETQVNGLQNYNLQNVNLFFLTKKTVHIV